MNQENLLLKSRIFLLTTFAHGMTLKEAIMVFNIFPIWTLIYSYSYGLGIRNILKTENDFHTSLTNISNSSGICHRKMKVPSLELWSISSEDVLAELPVDAVRENDVRKVQNCIFSAVYPTPFISSVQLIAASEDVLENLLDLDISVTKSNIFLQFVSGMKTIPGFVPLAHRYGGHQFGFWAGQLGDGRAHLIGIYTNRFGERWELQLKGSGRTPYSRLVVSNDVVWRDQFYNGNITKERGAVVLRVAKSWFRIGSLEILTLSREFALLRKLVDFIIKEHFPSISIDDPNRVLAFFSNVVSETAYLIAMWMSVGFAHGVCNTDNFSLLSITIDYGPFGFMESYNPDYVPNTSDDEGRYKIGNQATVGMFNLNKLLLALTPIMDTRQKQLAAQVLEVFPAMYYRRFTELFSAKLGFLDSSEEDMTLIASFLYLMEDTKSDFTMTFRQLGEVTQDQLQNLTIPQEYWALRDVSLHKNFPEWVKMYLQRLKRNPDDSESKRRQRMATTNPRYVLRNWMAESAVRKATTNDFSEVQLLLKTLRKPFQKQKLAEEAGYSDRTPEWAKDLKVSCSS
ncbi:protein adenylyltransferase SelO, mitochondrial isoform X2 [Bombina bombina]|uniref:protein adenylyltransferase SelO, mitochondrial isoform X2 n=1 Tax=Bombina bombina TaxID=8345 RepID=UPI00235AB4C3|nr:protein adenylyltransferase SelO, mitochondrial isoform X2 [Bombina bombina]